MAFSVEPSTNASGCLFPVDVDAERHDAARLGEVHPVDHQRHQIQPGQIRAKAARPARFRSSPRTGGRPPTCLSPRIFGDLLADRLQPPPGSGGPTARPASAPSPSCPGSRSRRTAHTRAIGSSPARRRPAPAVGSPAPGARPGSPTALTAVPHRGPRPVVFALRARPTRSRRPPSARPSPAGPHSTARASRPSCTFSAISVIATLTRSGTAVVQPRAGFGYSSSRRSPCCRSSLAERPTPTHGGQAGDRHPSETGGLDVEARP